MNRVDEHAIRNLVC